MLVEVDFDSAYMLRVDREPCCLAQYAEVMQWGYRIGLPLIFCNPEVVSALITQADLSLMCSEILSCASLVSLATPPIQGCGA